MAYSGGSEYSAAVFSSCASPACRPLTTAAAWGRKASAISTTMAEMMSTAASVTTPAALARPQARLRRAMTYGAKVAATIPARSTEAVVVDSVMASQTADDRKSDRGEDPPTDGAQPDQPLRDQRSASAHHRSRGVRLGTAFDYPCWRERRSRAER